MLPFRLVIIFLLSFLGATQIFAAQEEKVVPDWVHNPKSGCSAFELCAVGSASGMMNAQMVARSELAKIFSTQVQTNLKSTTTAQQKSKNDVIIQGEVSDDLMMTVEEKSAEALQSATIKSTYEDQNNFYALAALNKDAASKFIKKELQIIDEKIIAFDKQGTRGAITRALRLMEERELLHWRYEFLSGMRIDCPIKYQSLVDKKLKVVEKNVVVLLSLKEEAEKESKTFSKDLENIIAQQLVDQDYIVVTDKAMGHQFEVKAELHYEKMHFNVNGFEKYKFLLTLKNGNRGEKKAMINCQVEQTGRNLSQAFELALPVMKKYIDDNFDQLAL